MVYGCLTPSWRWPTWQSRHDETKGSRAAWSNGNIMWASCLISDLRIVSTFFNLKREIDEIDLSNILFHSVYQKYYHSSCNQCKITNEILHSFFKCGWNLLCVTLSGHLMATCAQVLHGTRSVTCKSLLFYLASHTTLGLAGKPTVIFPSSWIIDLYFIM